MVRGIDDAEMDGTIRMFYLTRARKGGITLPLAKEGELGATLVRWQRVIVVQSDFAT